MGHKTGYIKIFDTTLRDGDQAPGFTMFDWEKREIAEMLAQANVDVIEAGFPAASKGELEGVKSIAEYITAKYNSADGPVIAGLSMATESNIKAAAEALQPAIARGKGRIHTFIATSQVHADRKLRKTQEQILEMSVNAVKLAKSYTSDVEFSPEDASRTGIEFLLEVSKAAAEAGANVINIPDTVGYAVPEEYGQIIRQVVKAVSPYAIVSTHCHNDLGNAVNNSIAALMNGAIQVEGTINGIGERAGNTSIEQIVANLVVRQDYFAKKEIYTRFDTEMIGPLSRMIAMATGKWPAPNTPVVGINAFSHEAGIHQHGVTADSSTYEIMNPTKWGWHGEKFVVGKHSGKHGVKYVLSVLGYDNVTNEHVEHARGMIKDIAEEKKHIYDNDIRAIVHNLGYKPRTSIIEFNPDDMVYTRVVQPAARFNISIDGIVSLAKGQGNGPINAAHYAINEIVGDGIEFVDYALSTTGTGSDAMAQARVTIRKADRLYVARGGHSDIVGASVQAYINAINRARVEIKV